MVFIVEGVVNKDTEDARVENERVDKSRSTGSGGAGAINPVLGTPGTDNTEHSSAGTFAE